MTTLKGSQVASPALPTRRTPFDDGSTFDGGLPFDGGLRFDGGSPLDGGGLAAEVGDRSASDGTRWTLRMRVFVTRARLDRQIAAAGPCKSSAALALRARQLTDPATRRQIARSLREMVDYVVNRSSRPVFSAVVIAPGPVRTGRQAIIGLAQQLEGATPVSPRGVALAKGLITDGLSPLFNPYSERTVAEAVREVQDALTTRPAVGLDAAAA